jgi:hypothetical protein
MSVIPPTFDELVAESTRVVRGKVTAVRSAYVDTPQGQAIKTYVTVQVAHTLKGAATPTVELQFLGGTIGGDALTIPGMPKFRSGQDAIFFIGRNGETFCPLIAAGHGCYRVHREPGTQRDYVTRDNGVPLASTDEVSEPLEEIAAAPVAPAQALTPADFEAKIAHTVARQIAARPVPPR